jgi:hypothetical protein
MARQFTKKMIVSSLGAISTLAFAGTAQADCHSSTHCHSSTSTAAHSAYNPPALSTWSAHNAAAHSSTAPIRYSSASSQSSTSYAAAPIRYQTSSRAVSSAACPAGSTRQADGICLSTTSAFGSSSISAAYSDYSVAPLTRSVMSGLGANESLQPTSCPVSVHNPGGAKVLGCYNVIKPKPVVRTVVRKVVHTVPTVYQVVRPVIYVRTPVPVCNTCCTPKTVFSRYGGPVQAASSCGW